MGLTSPSITEATTESNAKALLAEYLSNWFDGNPHEISNTESGNFPLAGIAFDQGPITRQPLGDPAVSGATGVEIRVLIDPMDCTAYKDDEGQRVHDGVDLLFWVRAEKRRFGDGDSNKLANNTAELLRAILNNPVHKRDLAQRGFANMRKARYPKTFADSDYAIRLVKCRCQLHYHAKF